MACSSPRPPPDHPEDGFATPVAAAICLAMAVTATAVMSLAVSALTGARRDYERAQGEYELAGARLSAAQVLFQSTNTSRVRWTISTREGAVEVLAEPEGAKLSPKAAEANAAALAGLLGVRDTGTLERGLSTLGEHQDVSAEDVAALDASPLWRRCGPSFVSAHGVAEALPSARPLPPRPGPINWRLGQLWRLRLTNAQGWTDDSVVRFTGAPGHPIAVSSRRFTHSGPLGNTCDLIAQDAPA